MVTGSAESGGLLTKHPARSKTSRSRFVLCDYADDFWTKGMPLPKFKKSLAVNLKPGENISSCLSSDLSFCKPWNSNAEKISILASDLVRLKVVSPMDARDMVRIWGLEGLGEKSGATLNRAKEKVKTTKGEVLGDADYNFFSTCNDPAKYTTRQTYKCFTVSQESGGNFDDTRHYSGDFGDRRFVENLRGKLMDTSSDRDYEEAAGRQGGELTP